VTRCLSSRLWGNQPYLLQRSRHGNRLERCELEQAGRMMRAQAERKQVFLLVHPILSEGFIRPADAKRPAGKQRKHITEAITALQKRLSDDETSFVTMQNVVEQCCNFSCEKVVSPAATKSYGPFPCFPLGCSPMQETMEAPPARPIDSPSIQRCRSPTSRCVPGCADESGDP